MRWFAAEELDADPSGNILGIDAGSHTEGAPGGIDALSSRMWSGICRRCSIGGDRRRRNVGRETRSSYAAVSSMTAVGHAVPVKLRWTDGGRPTMIQGTGRALLDPETQKFTTATPCKGGDCDGRRSHRGIAVAVSPGDGVPSASTQPVRDPRTLCDGESPIPRAGNRQVLAAPSKPAGVGRGTRSPRPIRTDTLPGNRKVGR
jgi:hypothetical protein